jgi:Tol biopolymer transport system component
MATEGTVVMRRFLFGCAVAALALALLVPAASEAAYPGANGRVAYESYHDGDGEIMIGTDDGSGSIQATSNTVIDKDPVWSPDGKKIAFARRNASTSLFEIWTMNADGSGQTALVVQPRSVTHPTWSGDGTKIAFEYAFSGTDDDIYTASTSGLNTSVVPFLSSAAHERDPAWAPQGNTVAFSFFNATTTHFELRKATFPTTQVSSPFVSDATHDLTEPAWSPDGAKIAYQYTASFSNEDLYTANADGSGVSPLVNTTTGEQNPAWAPEGQMNLYDRLESNAEIYLTQILGTGWVMESRPSGNDHNPDWQPVTAAQVRPLAANQVSIPLVPAFKQCTSPNSTHSPPFSFGTCSPPRAASIELTVGEPQVNGKAAKEVGYVKVKTLSPSDGRLIVSITDVRCARFLSAGQCAGTGSGVLSDYLGNLMLNYSVRITDRLSAGGAAGTLQDTAFSAQVPCTGTPDPAVGSTCALNTTFNTLAAGAITPGKRAIWEFRGVNLDDRRGGIFAVGGTFYP